MATIVMESAKVIEAAEKTIAQIKAKRVTRDEKKIAQRMEDKTFSFRRGFYYMTREEAIDWLDTSCDRYFGWRSIYAWGDLEKARDLLRLAQHGDPVTLNEGDIKVLF